MASAPSSASRSRYDVFLSFRGEDTRETFTRRLRGALRRKKINPFIDDEIVRGEEIAAALFKEIEESSISVVIFSQKYASSTWCLDELVHIMECKEKYQQVVIPIFYKVDPSHVRCQRETYAAAFVQHEQHFKDMPDKVLKWRAALTKASELAGFVSHNFSSDSKLVEEVVTDIVMKLNRKSVAQDECYKCGKLGHWAKDCTSCDECFGCGYPGHWVQDCPRREDICFKCGCPGHWQTECPNSKWWR